MPRPKPPHPLLWLVEPLLHQPSFVQRAMFGCEAVYLHGRLMLCLAAKQEPWHGVLLPTSRHHHASLQAEWPALQPHAVLGKWLYLSHSHEQFEPLAEHFVQRMARNDPRLGVVPTR